MGKYEDSIPVYQKALQIQPYAGTSIATVAANPANASTKRIRATFKTHSHLVITSRLKNSTSWAKGRYQDNKISALESVDEPWHWGQDPGLCKRLRKEGKRESLNGAQATQKDTDRDSTVWFSCRFFPRRKRGNSVRHSAAVAIE